MLGIKYINGKLQSYDKSLSVNLPNIFKRKGWNDTNSFGTSIVNNIWVLIQQRERAEFLLLHC